MINFNNSVLAGLVNVVKSVFNILLSWLIFILALRFIVTQYRTKNSLFSLFRNSFNKLHKMIMLLLSEYKQKSFSKKSCQSSNHEIENRFNQIKDTLNFNLCSQSDLVKVIKDIQLLKSLHPKKQNSSLNYDKMMFKTILQEQENGQYSQLFSEFEYLNEILDKEQIILNIRNLEIDFLFDERLEKYYTLQTSYEQIPKIENNSQQQYIQQQKIQQQSAHDENILNEQKQQITENKLPSIYIHKQLFVQFIQFYNYNFQAFEFEKKSNLKYTQALMIQNQPYITNSNNLNLQMPDNILIFNSQNEFQNYTRSFLTLILYVKTFNQSIHPYINYLKEYTLMDILIKD
ncbi:hypothetical protein ABPG74_017937 [Tetrahymena malaccensis]